MDVVFFYTFCIKRRLQDTDFFNLKTVYIRQPKVNRLAVNSAKKVAQAAPSNPNLGIKRKLKIISVAQEITLQIAFPLTTFKAARKLTLKERNVPATQYPPINIRNGVTAARYCFPAIT